MTVAPAPRSKRMSINSVYPHVHALHCWRSIRFSASNSASKVAVSCSKFFGLDTLLENATHVQEAIESPLVTE